PLARGSALGSPSSELRAGESGGARTGAFSGDLRHGVEDDVFQTGVVGVENADDLVGADRGEAGFALDANVVIGDERNVDITDLELPREDDFRVLGHVDDLPTLRAEPPALRPSAEARTLDHDHGAFRSHVDAAGLAGVVHDAPQLGTVGVGAADVRRDGAVVVRVLAAGRAIDELITDHEALALHMRLEAADGARTEDALHAQLAHGVDVGAVVHHVGRHLVLSPVARQESDAAAGNLADGEPVAGRTVGCVHSDHPCVLQKAVEAGSTKDADLGRVASHVALPRYATASTPLTKRSRSDLKGGRAMPALVIMPVMYRAGVTSKAGCAAWTPSGATRTPA